MPKVDRRILIMRGRLPISSGGGRRSSTKAFDPARWCNDWLLKSLDFWDEVETEMEIEELEREIEQVSRY